MKKEIYILGLNSSPRFRNNPGSQQESTTRILLEYSLNYALEKKKAKVLLVDLHKMNMKECNGCYSTDENLCSPSFEKKFENSKEVYNGCRCFDDDYKIVEKEILKADSVIFASPTNYGLPNPRILNVFNRMTALWQCVRIDDKIIESPLVGKVAGAISTAHHAGALEVVYRMLMLANDLGFMIPPNAFAYTQGDVNKSTVLNKEVLNNDATLAHNLEVMVDNICKGVRSSRRARWNKGYLENSHLMSLEELNSKFDYTKEMNRYLKEEWDKLLKKEANGKDLNSRVKGKVPTLP
ncbi:flavodoxin family protein [Candidatus Woesearchaeota archaeon]|nr:flavodoxin family protein [Candidatus Woesearchaeota archaeon]